MLHADHVGAGFCCFRSTIEADGPSIRCRVVVGPCVRAIGHGESCTESYSFYLGVTYVTSAHISLAKQVIKLYQCHEMKM